MERERPWLEDEKVYLLTEILKASNADPVDVLWNYARANAISPAWNDIALPKGRTLNQCQRWFHELQGRPTFIHTSGPQIPSPFLNPTTGIPRKRPLPADAQTPTGRPIQPKLPYTFPTDITGHVPLSPAETQKDTGKRRGRPTKAEQERRRQEAMVKGEVYPPPKPSKSQRPPPVPGAPQSQPPTPGALPVTRMTPPVTIKADVEAGNSSSKKRRTRPSQAETVEAQVLTRPEGTTTTAYESPPHTGPLQSPPETRGSISAGPSSGPLASPAAPERPEREAQEEGREPPRRTWEQTIL